MTSSRQTLPQLTWMTKKRSLRSITATCRSVCCTRWTTRKARVKARHAHKWGCKVRPRGSSTRRTWRRSSIAWCKMSRGWASSWKTYTRWNFTRKLKSSDLKIVMILRNTSIGTLNWHTCGKNMKKIGSAWSANTTLKSLLKLDRSRKAWMKKIEIWR